MRRSRFSFSFIGLSGFLFLLILSCVPSILAAVTLTVGVADPDSLYGQLGSNFAVQFTATDSTVPAPPSPTYTYTLVSGTLPPGTFFVSEGEITNAPTAEGEYNIVVRASDGTNTSPNTPVRLCVGIPISPTTLPNTNITVGVAIAPVTITSTCSNDDGVDDVDYTLSGHPTGIELVDNTDGTATLRGTATQEGTFTLRITAEDSAGRTSFRDYTITSTLPPLIATPDRLPPGFLNTLYDSTTVVFSNRPVPLLVERQDGVGETFLPAGMTLVTANGQFTLSGTPTETGSFRVTVKVTDNNAKETTLSFPFTVTLPRLTITPGSLPDGQAGQPYDEEIRVTGGKAPYRFDILVNPTNPGFSLVPATGESADGLISINGTPRTAGVYRITVHVTDDSEPEREGTIVYTVAISGGPVPIYDSLPPRGSTIYFDTVTVPGSDVLEQLVVINRGQRTLTVSAPGTEPESAFSGPNAGDFRFFRTSPFAFPTFDVPSGFSSTVVIICRPSSTLLVSVATLTLNTNDPQRPTATYELRCNTAETPSTPGVGTPTAISGTAAPSVLVLGRATGVVTQAPNTFATLTFVKGLSLRSGPYLGATMLGVLQRDKEYPVLAVNGGDGEGNFNWYLVIDTDNNRIGWASGRYLILKGDPNIAFAPTIFDQIDNTSDVGARLTIFGNVNMRVRPSERMPVVHTTAYGTELEILGRTQQAGITQWLHVRFYDGATNRTVIGWIYYNFNAPELMKLTGIAPLDAVPIR